MVSVDVKHWSQPVVGNVAGIGDVKTVVSWVYVVRSTKISLSIVQELCDRRGGRPGLSVLTSLMVVVDIKQY